MFETEIQQTIDFLSSDSALKTVIADSYWPKWDAPWWHMRLLDEMGLVGEIPEQMIEAFIASLNRLPLKIFPIYPNEMPAHVDPFRGTACHCQLGTVYQALSNRGIDVDAALPWIRPWFLRYQMSDGGFNCDNDAYLVKDECPSSMVGTISIFEAVLKIKNWTPEECAFVDRTANFLIRRQLTLGSATQYNKSERQGAKAWAQLCFPRFYFYDVLRGLTALTAWAEKTNQVLPKSATEEVVSALQARFPTGEVRVERIAFANHSTLKQMPSGNWLRKQPTGTFPLLDRVSRIGDISPFLSRDWELTVAKL